MCNSKYKFLQQFLTLADAIDFEDSVLSAAREFLPDYVCAVVRGEEEPTPAYWEFLLEQAEKAGV